jgi:hypothetical protein
VNNFRFSSIATTIAVVGAFTNKAKKVLAWSLCVLMILSPFPGCGGGGGGSQHNPTDPTVIWTTPAAITYGTALSATQLDATLSVAGSCTYSPASGAILSAGTPTDTATCTPSDTYNYNTVSKSVSITVNKAALTVAANNASMNHGSPLPALTGTLTGVVNNDGITASYTTTATSSSPAGTYPITATLNDPNGKLGNYTVTNTSGTLTVTAVIVTPTTTGVLPMLVTPGHGGFTLTVNGTNFTSGATVYVNGSSRTTTFVSSTQLTASIPAADVASAGTLAITVKNPGTAASNSQSLLVGKTVTASSLATAVVSSTTTGDGFGSSVAYLGDITGDGKCPNAVGVSTTYTGYVLCDYTKLSGTVTLAQIGTSALPGFKITNSGTLGGATVFVIRGGGDLNGDGINDFVVGVGAWQPSSTPYIGAVFAVKGGTYLSSLTTLDLNDSTKPITFAEGVNQEAFAGNSMSGFADFNGDGTADVLFSSPGYGYNSTINSGPGAVYLLYGSSNFFNSRKLDLNQIGSAVPGAMFTVRNWDATSPGALGSLYPDSVNLEYVADVNNDGLPDFLIGGAELNKTPNTQWTYVVFGGNLSGTYYVQDIGATFKGATFTTDRSECSQASGGFCSVNFGTSVSGVGGKLFISDYLGYLTGAQSGYGMVVAYDQVLSNGQVVDIRQVSRSLNASSVFGTQNYLELFGFAVTDGADYRMVSAINFNNNGEGRVLILPATGLPWGISAVSNSTELEIDGDAANDELGVFLLRLPNGGAMVTTYGTNINKVYYFGPGSFLL